MFESHYPLDGKPTNPTALNLPVSILVPSQLFANAKYVLQKMICPLNITFCVVGIFLDGARPPGPFGGLGGDGVVYGTFKFFCVLYFDFPYLHVNLLHYHYRSPNESVWFTCNACVGAELHLYLSDGAFPAVRGWFIEYLKSLGSITAETPDIEMECHKAVYDAVQTAMKCGVCREKAVAQLFEFVSGLSLKAKVQEQFDLVPLKF
ncbi:hypothetical protein B0H13DRAFT_2332418 [Mycena leptocephala]|nr:hypothetical protein B0H13DRAFT_2332418 [Mycena leptocephala]